MHHTERTKIFETGATDNPLDEVVYLLQEINPQIDCKLIQEAHLEIAGIFTGNHPGFKSCDAKYHNLAHTYSVALATIRLFHGLHCEKYVFDKDVILQGMISAYFHDTGLLLTVADTTASGASYTVDHEDRSVSFMNEYLSHCGVDESFMKHCESMVQCTKIGLDPGTLRFESEEHQLAGFILGSADLLAQMADRCYLERLPWLFQEMKDGGVNNYASVTDLMRETNTFYQQLVVNRLESSFKDLKKVMRTHFRERWNMDENLYVDNIRKNLDYVSKIAPQSDDQPVDLSQYLRRIPNS